MTTESGAPTAASGAEAPSTAPPERNGLHLPKRDALSSGSAVGACSRDSNSARKSESKSNTDAPASVSSHSNGGPTSKADAAAVPGGDAAAAAAAADEAVEAAAAAAAKLKLFQQRRASLDHKTPLELLTPLVDGFTERLHGEHTAKLSALRERIGATSPHLADHFAESEHGSDISLYRHLHARSWSLDGAHEQLTKTLEWRVEYDTDQLMADPDPLERFYRYCTPHAYAGHDKEHRPIYWERTGHIDVPEILKVCTFDEMRRRHVWGMEYNARSAARNSKRFNKLIYQHVVVMDLADLSVSPDKRALQLFRDINHIDQKYYPERLGHLFILNAPWYFRTLWVMIKTFLSQATIAKFHLLGTDYHEELTKYIDVDQIPKEYGGTASFELGKAHTLAEAVQAGVLPGDLLWVDTRAQRELMPDAPALLKHLAESRRAASRGKRRSSAASGGAKSSGWFW